MYELQPGIAELLASEHGPDLMAAVRGPDDFQAYSLKWIFTARLRSVLFKDYPGDYRADNQYLQWKTLTNALVEYDHHGSAHYLVHIRDALLILQCKPTHDMELVYLKNLAQEFLACENGKITNRMITLFESL